MVYYSIYIKENPKALAIGIEFFPVNSLHNEVVKLLAFTSEDKDSLKRFNFLLSNLREQIAVAKMMQKMKKLHKKRGVIVMGFYHEKSLRKLLKSLKIKTKIFSAF